MSEIEQEAEKLLGAYAATFRKAKADVTTSQRIDVQLYDLSLALLARLREVQEELASNRACNLYTWKEQFQKAEAERDQLRQQLEWTEALVANMREANGRLCEAEAQLRQQLAEKE